MCYAPVHPLYLSPCLQVNDAVAEQFERLVPNLLGIVPVLKHGPWVQVVPNLVQVLYQLVVIGLGLKLLWHFRQTCRFEHVNDQHRVVGGQ